MRANLPTSSLERAYRITCNFSHAYSFNFYLQGSIEGGGGEREKAVKFDSKYLFSKIACGNETSTTSRSNQMFGSASFSFYNCNSCTGVLILLFFFVNQFKA